MIEHVKIAEYDDEKYGLISEFINRNDEIVFAYTKVFNNKYTYEFVSNKINKELIEKYLSNHD